ncbi:MAG TPA: BatD family protein [Candidatus Ozemobacteraceae bacterium]|nr:BatD family protein [Candidatus Ozemobacteraceae bacterium]
MAKRRFVACIVLMMTVLGCWTVLAQEMSLEAETDRTTVKFGESLTLSVTLSQAIGGAAPGRIVTPNIESIPDFDIAGRQTSQNMSFINGVGSLQIRTVLELVPRGPGNFTIPALSLKLPDGRSVSSKPIAVKVLPPSEEAPGAATEAAPPAEDDTARVSGNGGMSLVTAALVLVLVVALVIGLPILLSWYLSRRAERPSRTDAGSGNKPAATVRPTADREDPPEEAEIVPVVKHPGSPVEFDREIERLKREFPDVGLEFYRKYYDILHGALVGSHAKLGAMKTPDELRRTMEGVVPPAVAARLNEVFEEWEGVTYARILPTRGFQAILEDSRALLCAVTQKQETHR